MNVDKIDDDHYRRKFAKKITKRVWGVDFLQENETGFYAIDGEFDFTFTTDGMIKSIYYDGLDFDIDCDSGTASCTPIVVGPEREPSILSIACQTKDLAHQLLLNFYFQKYKYFTFDISDIFHVHDTVDENPVHAHDDSSQRRVTVAAAAAAAKAGAVRAASQHGIGGGRPK